MIIRIDWGTHTLLKYNHITHVIKEKGSFRFRYCEMQECIGIIIDDVTQAVIHDGRLLTRAMIGSRFDEWVRLVVDQTSCERELAEICLIKTEGDVVYAIMQVTKI